MEENKIINYDRPQDKYGLLRHWRAKQFSEIYSQLSTVLMNHNIRTILDCACGEGLYAEAPSDSWQVFAADPSEEAGDRLKKRKASIPFRCSDLLHLEEVYPEKFDAVICMEDDLLRYYEEEDTLAAIRSMLGRLKQGGILVFHIMDLEPLVYCGKEANSALTPLLLGEELNGTRNSLIRILDFVAHWDSVIARYIYHLEDLSTGAVTVDWDQVRYIAAADDDPGDYIELAGGFFHEQIVVGDDLLLVGGTEPPDTYAGPPTIHWKEEAADSGEA